MARLPSHVRVRQAGARDLDWVVKRHAAIYRQERHYNDDFGAIVRAIVGRFRRRRDAARERAWIALHRGKPAGCVFVTRRSPSTGQLRLLLVEPAARGLGLGRKLVESCIEFARDAGYRRLMLWTSDELDVARQLYSAAGFRLVSAEPTRHFGRSQMSEIWTLAL